MSPDNNVLMSVDNNVLMSVDRQLLQAWPVMWASDIVDQLVQHGPNQIIVWHEG